MEQDLWQIRRRKRMTIEELARNANIHPSLIKAYELGQRPIPAADLEKLAKALMVEPWEIKELSDPPPRGPSRYGGSESSSFGDEVPRQRYGTRETSAPRYDNDRPRFETERPERPRFDAERSSRFDSEAPRFDSDTPRPRYGSDAPRPRFDSEGGSRFGESSNRYGDSNNRYGDSGSRYGDSGSRYSSDSSRSRYGSSDASRSPRYDDGRRGYSSDIRDRDRGRDRDRDRGVRPMGRPLRKGRVQRRPQAGPARPSQLEHLKALVIRLELNGDEVLRMAGKPLSMLNRKEAASLLTMCQDMLAERKPPRPKGKRQRPYLPESVDEHELIYLTEVQMGKQDLHLTLFNGDKISGKLLGFSPYALTLTQPGGQELTVQKLAIAYYQLDRQAAEEAAGEPA